MTFNASYQPEPLPEPPLPTLEGSERDFMLNEFQRVRLTLNQCVDAIEEMQRHLESLA